MRPILQLALAYIFAGFHEKELLSSSNKSEVYFRYINHTFCRFDSETGGLFFDFP